MQRVTLGDQPLDHAGAFFLQEPDMIVGVSPASGELLVRRCKLRLEVALEVLVEGERGLA